MTEPLLNFRSVQAATEQVRAWAISIKLVHQMGKKWAG